MRRAGGSLSWAVLVGVPATPETPQKQRKARMHAGMSTECGRDACLAG